MNKPRCPVINYIRDGQGADAANYHNAANYWPNTIPGAPNPNPAWS